MKIVTILFLLLLVSPVFGELTKDDLEAIRSIVKEEGAASEKRMKEYIDLKIDGVEKSLNARIDGVDEKLSARIEGLDEKLSARIEGLDKRMSDMWRLMMGLFGLVQRRLPSLKSLLLTEIEAGRGCRLKLTNFAKKLKQCSNEPISFSRFSLSVFSPASLPPCVLALKFLPFSGLPLVLCASAVYGLHITQKVLINQ